MILIMQSLRCKNNKHNLNAFLNLVLQKKYFILPFTTLNPVGLVLQNKSVDYFVLPASNADWQMFYNNHILFIHTD